MKCKLISGNKSSSFWQIPAVSNLLKSNFNLVATRLCYLWKKLENKRVFVIDKIGQLEESFQKASDWLAPTRAGGEN